MSEQRQTYPKTHRLSGKESFAAVYDARTRQSRGPLTMYAKPNDMSHSRIGISISRRVGIAPKRNRIKRLLRESYRLGRRDIPTGYDWIIVVRPHEVLGLPDYQRLLKELTNGLHILWTKRVR